MTFRGFRIPPRNTALITWDICGKIEEFGFNKNPDPCKCNSKHILPEPLSDLQKKKKRLNKPINIACDFSIQLYFENPNLSCTPKCDKTLIVLTDAADIRFEVVLSHIMKG